MQHMRAVFLHSGWRVGSTYFWSKFRHDAGCLAFYEPFNEVLGSLAPEHVILANPPQGAFHHPEQEFAYFHEYLPLLGANGHPLFRDEFSLRNYFVRSEPLAEQHAYIDSLLQLAAKTGKIPVLSFVRSRGRVAWFKRHFDGVNIVLIRSPFNQWISGQRLAAEHGYKFFDPMQFVILSSAEGSASAIRHAEHHRIQRLSHLPSAAVRSALHQVIDSTPPEQRFAVFASVYFLSYMAAVPQADLVVDIDRLSSNPGYRTRTTLEIQRLTGVTLDLSDAAAPRYAPDRRSPVFAVLDRVRREIATARGPLWGDDAGSGTGSDLAQQLILDKFSEDCERAQGTGWDLPLRWRRRAASWAFLVAKLFS